jgi:hypothetical protein
MPTKKTLKLTDKEICKKWLINKNINPKSMRKIKETGIVYKKLAEKCLDKNKEVKPKLSLNSNSKKIKAYKKIHKLFIPYINRTTANIIDRINYFLIIKKYIMTIKEKNNCFKINNIDDKNEITYKIGNKIILDKKIGSDGQYGFVYLSHFKFNINSNNKYNKLNKFAVKITEEDKFTKKEIEILKILTNEVIQLKCPHFPISYGFLKCNNIDINSDNNMEHLLPEFIKKYNSYSILINELASGDLLYYLKYVKNRDIINTLTQILLSIMFFYNSTKSYHTDCHVGNFLYHKIKPGGYFHYNIYNKDIYLENKGYLWVIWDFSFASPHKDMEYPINIDFVHILDCLEYFDDSFSNMKSKFTSIESTLISNLNTLLTDDYNHIKHPMYLDHINRDIINYLYINTDSFIITKPSNIINKTPFIIL